LSIFFAQIEMTHSDWIQSAQDDVAIVLENVPEAFDEFPEENLPIPGAPTWTITVPVQPAKLTTLPILSITLLSPPKLGPNA
jgi:hypothetical protein